MAHDFLDGDRVVTTRALISSHGDAVAGVHGRVSRGDQTQIPTGILLVTMSDGVTWALSPDALRHLTALECLAEIPTKELPT